MKIKYISDMSDKIRQKLPAYTQRLPIISWWEWSGCLFYSTREFCRK